jgi:hypothetical protein
VLFTIVTTLQKLQTKELFITTAVRTSNPTFHQRSQQIFTMGIYCQSENVTVIYCEGSKLQGDGIETVYCPNTRKTSNCTDQAPNFIHSLFPVALSLKHKASANRFVSLQFLDL